MFSNLPPKITRLAEVVREAGGQALLVGGCVRDALLGLEPKDWDIEVYGVAPAELRQAVGRFGRVKAVGESFAVYKIGQDLDVALPRRERKTGRGHRGFTVEGDPRMTVTEAARRRDFTLNAILFDPLTAQIFDPFDGRKDLSDRRLRVVAADTFVEDSLRVLRAAQFAARFDFDIEPATVELCRGIDLSDLPAERIWGEVEKIFLKASKPSVGWSWLDKLRATDQLFPELATLTTGQKSETWDALDAARQISHNLPPAKQLTLLLAALTHALSLAAAEDLLTRLNIHTYDGYSVRSQALVLHSHQAQPTAFFARRETVTDGEFRHLSLKCELGLLGALAVSLGQVEAGEWFSTRSQEIGVDEKPPAPLLLGRHILEVGLLAKPGPAVGQLLRAVYNQQLDGEVATFADALALARRLADTA